MKPVWDGNAFQPRLMLPLSLSYDHRVIDGALAARFTLTWARSSPISAAFSYDPRWWPSAKAARW